MPSESGIRRGHTFLFAITLVFAVIAASIATWLCARFNTHHNAYNHNVFIRSRFLAFTGWFTFLIGIIYMLWFLMSSESTAMGWFSHLVFLFIIWVFWLAGAASITAALGGGINCSGALFNIPYCNQLNALEAFSWITWIFVTFLFIASIFFGFRSMRRGDGVKGTIA